MTSIRQCHRRPNACTWLFVNPLGLHCKDRDGEELNTVKGAKESIGLEHLVSDLDFAD